MAQSDRVGMKPGHRRSPAQSRLVKLTLPSLSLIEFSAIISSRSAAGNRTPDGEAAYGGDLDRAVVFTPGEVVATPPAGGKPSRSMMSRSSIFPSFSALQQQRITALTKCEGAAMDD
jgi:hypothetical protein